PRAVRARPRRRSSAPTRGLRWSARSFHRAGGASPRGRRPDLYWWYSCLAPIDDPALGTRFLPVAVVGAQDPLDVSEVVGPPELLLDVRAFEDDPPRGADDYEPELLLDHRLLVGVLDHPRDGRGLFPG